MKNQLLTRYLQIAILMLSIQVFSQERTITGVMTDDSGLPLPGVYIMVKGTTRGTQTDFDGNYSIDCTIGDVLIFRYVGFTTREVVVTPEMFNEEGTTSLVKRRAVTLIQNKAYSDAVQQLATDFVIPNIENSRHTYNKNGSYFEYQRIKDIRVIAGKDNVKLTYFKPDIFYEIGFNSTTSMQFVQQRNLPKLQQIFSQGQPQNGQNTFLGPDVGSVFSYGPQLSSLQFDGNAYPYDQNGRLVPIGNGVNSPAIAYDNSIFENVIKTKNTLFFNVSTAKNILALEYTDNRTEDIFKTERSRYNEVSFRYNTAKNWDANVKWDAFIRYGQTVDNQPNLNGFLNTLLLNAWATPASFDTNQGIILPNGGQRSFSANYNNPLWLLQHNRNRVKNSTFLTSLQNEIRFSDDATMYTNVNYSHIAEKEDFGVFPNTVGFINGYSSDKNFNTNTFNAVATFKLRKNHRNSKFDFRSIANYTYKHVTYDLTEKTGFDLFSFNSPTTIDNRHKTIGRNTFQLLNKFRYTISDWDTTISIANTSFTSSIQNSKWILPKLQIETDLRDLIGGYWIRSLKVSANTAFDIKDTSMYYANQSHNSLDITPSQNIGFTANDDLFLTDELQLEEIRSYSFGTNFGFELFNKTVDFNFSYYNHKVDGSVFPVINQDRFELKNVADIEKYGFEGSLDVPLYKNHNFSYAPGIVFSLHRNKVISLDSDKTSIAIAGFSTISKSLVPGQPAGVLMGTAYARDDQSRVIMDNEGYPLIAPTPQIIGDPTPEFAIGFTNNFYWKKFSFNFLIDYQKGGDVWNGTQNVLNYLGTSQQSAEERKITDYVFSGVNQQGQPNTTPVDFANPANGISGNRFIRYGYEGVAEEAIVDGSYINLKSIKLSYDIKEQSSHGFIREFNIGVYANNLFTYTRYKGASPYSSLFDHASAQGLQFFNTPITSEIGIQIKIKI